MATLNEYMTKHSVTLSEIARRTGLSVSFVKYLREQQRRPSLATMELIETATEGEVSFTDWRKAPPQAPAATASPEAA